MIISLVDAEADLSTLISRAEAGEEILIARPDGSTARLTATPKVKKPLFGALAGVYPAIPDAFFFDPLPEDELKLWEGDDEASPR